MKVLWTILLSTLIQFSFWQMALQVPQAKSARPEQFVDLSFLQELEAEGFYNEMVKRYR